MNGDLLHHRRLIDYLLNQSLHKTFFYCLKANSHKKEATYTPLPSKAELASEIGLEALENVLKGNQFLSGDKATQVDIVAFEGLTGSPSFWKFRVSYKLHNLN